MMDCKHCDNFECEHRSSHEEDLCYYNNPNILTLEAINKVVEDVARYQKEWEEKNPLLKYFRDDEDLGRLVLAVLREFADCVRDPSYFNAKYNSGKKKL